MCLICSFVFVKNLLLSEFLFLFNGQKFAGKKQTENSTGPQLKSSSPQDDVDMQCEAGPSRLCLEAYDSDHVYESSGSEYQPNESESESDDEENIYHQSSHAKPEKEDEVNIDNQPSQSESEKEEEENMRANATPAIDGELNYSDQNLTVRGTKRVKVFPIKPKTSRKRTRDPESWTRRVAALCREKGESYISYTGKAVLPKNICSGCLCTEKCRLKCSTKFSDDKRKLILQDFYSLDVNSKNSLLFGNITPVDVARQRKNATNHKSHSYKYSLVLDNQQIHVCKTAFCALYQISRKKVDIIKGKMESGQSAPSKDARGRHMNRPHKISDVVEEAVVAHINRFPTEQSHYSRNSNPHKRYLAPNLNMSLMYRLYIEDCKEQNKPDNYLIKKSTYAKIFTTKFNLSFSHPKSDTCSKCDSGKSNAEHEENVKLGFELMSKDREKALKDKNECYITVDLQQTMPLPKLTTSKAFYLRQIWFYNLGIHVITTKGHQSVMQTWTEDVAGRGSAEVVSCLWNFVQTCDNAKMKKKLVVWSDSCAGQNKNFQMICLHQLMLLKGIFEVVDHKFPEVGHTYLDSDRDFGRIEKVLRNHGTILTPEQYRGIIKTACTKQSTVNDMAQYFRDVDNLPNKLGLVNKKKNLLNEKVPFRDGIKWIRIEEFGSYLYKESYDEYTPFKKVSLFKNNPPEDYSPPTDIEFTRIYHKTGNISQPKIDNIREQLPFIEEEHRGFYENIIGIEVEDPKQKRRRTK